jgi:hypothetical protein
VGTEFSGPPKPFHPTPRTPQTGVSGRCASVRTPAVNTTVPLNGTSSSEGRPPSIAVVLSPDFVRPVSTSSPLDMGCSPSRMRCARGA